MFNSDKQKAKLALSYSNYSREKLRNESCTEPTDDSKSSLFSLVSKLSATV